MNIDAIINLIAHERKIWESKILLSTDKNTTHREMLHSFRVLLEPYIYNLLILRYGLYLDNFWKTYMPPKISNRAFVIIERRCHPNLWFLLRNIAWAGPDLAVYIFCSNTNIEYIKGILGDKYNNFNIIQQFEGSPDRDTAICEYNRLLTDYKFYEKINTEWILLVQTDVFIRRKIPNSIFVGEYWGYPFGWRPEYPGGGGATIRNVKKLYELCKNNRPQGIPGIDFYEDAWLSEKILELNKEVPSFNFRREHIMENVLSVNPYIIHQFWTFVYNFMDQLDFETFKMYLNHILTFEICY